MKNDNLDYIHTISKIKYSVEILADERYIQKSDEVNVNYRVLIMIKNIDTGISVPHILLSSFLKEKYSKVKSKTTENAAYLLVKFLNYITFEKACIYRIKSLFYLTFNHANDYLDFYSLNASKQTTIQCELVLTKFFYYLAEKDLLKNVSCDMFVLNEKGNPRSPFNIEYSHKKTYPILHHLPKELIIPFLNFAFYEANDIAFGVYLEFLGGLRIGDVVNLTYDNIACYGGNASEGMVVKIVNNDLRPDLIRGNVREGVKIERYQYVIPLNNLLHKIYKEHQQKYKNNNEKNAVFINKDGLPMTKATYRKRFNKLKKAFINKLSESDDMKLKMFSLTLLSKKWSTHLGRGVFSNLVGDVSNTVLEIALMRGDRTFNAALSYLSDCSRIAQKVQENLNDMYMDLITKQK